jgi:hypothetical protein
LADDRLLGPPSGHRLHHYRAGQRPHVIEEFAFQFSRDWTAEIDPSLSGNRTQPSHVSN